MGNVLLQGNRKGDPTDEYERWLQQNPDLVGKEILNQNKLFRTSSYKFNSRNIIIKVFFKRDPAPLTEYLKIFQFFNHINQKYKTTNILPLKLFGDKDNQSFIVAYRQKMAQTLQDVILAKPTPTMSKKKWLIYQMIKAVYIIHKHFNFYHGHIRTSNFVITTYGYLMLTDFAFYKPLYMLEDTQQGLPQFRLFYSSSIANCTLAPQKITQQVDIKNKQRSPAKIFSNYQNPTQTHHSHSSSFSVDTSNTGLETLTSAQLSIPPNNLTLSTSRSSQFYDNPKQRSVQILQSNRPQFNYFDQIYYLQKMDIYSLGCSILQVLRDGKPLMNFETYLKFKKGNAPLDSYIDDACKGIQNQDKIKSLLTAMLSKNPDDRPSIQEVMRQFSSYINIDVYSLIWHCSSVFSTTSFFLPDQRIALVHSIVKFIQSQQRNNNLDFKILPPKCFDVFEPLKIFRSILKNKIIHVGLIPQNSVLRKIMDSTQKQDCVASQEQQIVKEESDTRKQFFIPVASRKSNSSVRMSTAMIPKLQKILCPPEWDRQIKSLLQPKYKGNRLTPTQIQKNRFQDLLEQYKKNQYLRSIRLQQISYFYKQYNMVIRIVYSCLRGCKYNASKLIGIQIMMAIAKQSSDQVKISRLIPLLISLLDDPDSVTSKYALNSIINLFYLFIDPFRTEEDTHYYEIIIQMFMNSIKTPRLRVNLFRRLTQIYSICEWLEVHIKKISKKLQMKNDLRKLVQFIKQNFCSYKPHQIRQLIINIPNVIWPQMFEFFISFLNTQKILGLQKGISITSIDIQCHKKIIDAVDSCIESGLDENGFSLYYAIKYFTCRKICSVYIVKKIGPMVIHPHLWVRQQAKQYLQMCLQQNPPTRIFFLFRQIFTPPFPLQPKDIIDNILLPQPLLQNQVDFTKRKIKQTRKIGITQKHFLQYLQKVKSSKSFPITRENQIQQWTNLSKAIVQQKSQSTPFNNYIKKVIVELFQANFLYYVGNFKYPFKYALKQQQRKKQYQQLYDTLKKLNILFQDSQVSYDKKQFFISLCTIVNSNFEKLLTRFLKQDKTNKIRISESIYLIMDTLNKFQQFGIKQTLKLGQYNPKMFDMEKVLRPKGSLITQIYEHKDVITSLQNIADKFLITASYDGTVRIFNVKKIQVNITCQSDGVYEISSDNSQQKVRINSLASFENTYTVAAATNKGNIRIFQIQRMRSKGFQSSRINRGDSSSNSQLLKYFVGGQIEKILTFKNQNRNECFCFVTGQGVLGLQDIRTRSKTMSCNFGKQRGLPKSLAFSNLGPSILIGTIDGYVLTYDIRCNLISNVRQLLYQNNPVSITGIYPSPYTVDGRNLFAFTYPSKYYEFSYFDIYNDTAEFLAQKHYTSCDRQDIISIPTMVNKTKQQNFKLCNNSLSQKIYYKQLADFTKNFKILQYLSDPFTIKQAKIREVWMDRCKHRYNQIYSIYNKKVIPFIEHLQSGLLTNLNPCLTCPSQKKSNRNLSVLVDKMQTKQYYQSQKLVSCRPPNSKIYTFPDQQNADYLTCCKTMGNMVFVGGWDSVIKIYK